MANKNKYKKPDFVKNIEKNNKEMEKSGEQVIKNLQKLNEKQEEYGEQVFKRLKRNWRKNNE
jgi:hypothetical protein